MVRSQSERRDNCKLRMPYVSLEQKSARERYIRVAAIDIVISEGIKNICVA
jgi:hypothetical protein